MNSGIKGKFRELLAEYGIEDWPSSFCDCARPRAKFNLDHARYLCAGSAASPRNNHNSFRAARLMPPLPAVVCTRRDPEKSYVFFSIKIINFAERS